MGLIPGLGILKNADEVVTLLKNALPQLMPYADEMATVLRQAFQNGGLGLGALAGGTKYVDDLADGVDELSDAARTAERLTETGEVVADGIKTTGGAADGTDEIIDTSLSGVYNGQKGSDLEVREWYVSKVSAISDSVDKDLPLEERA